VTEDNDLAEQRQSLHLLLRWDAEPPLPCEEPPDVLVRLLERGSEPALGSLFWAAFRGTVDDPGTAQSALSDAVDALNGRWGPAVQEASTAAWDKADMVSAVVVVRDDAHAGIPLLAFAATHPAWQRRGLARVLICKAVHALHAHGHRELHLAVTIGNPALTLYTSLGFALVNRQ
jgi:GNAT superfamily N-acetyltransferase